MRVVIQRVKRASVSVNGRVTGTVGKGMVIFLGVTHSDTTNDAAYLSHRCANLRIFEDAEGKMNRSIREVDGSVLVVSQFTLYADTRKGNRPSFVDAATPQHAEQLYEEFVQFLQQELGDSKVATGVFRAMMDVELVNDGPVTLVVESKPHAT
jgi:D-tyrosyl-tRNA(Tyr) deacylase